MNRASVRRWGVRSDDGRPIEAVKTSQAGGDRTFMDPVAAERTHLRRPRGRARRRARRTRRLRAVIDDVGEEDREEELTRGQPFDEAHGAATARARPRARERGTARRCGDGWWRHERRELVGAAPGREQAEVANADEAFRQDVQEEAPEEFVDVECQRPHLAPVPIVLPPKRDRVVRDGDEPVIGDGDAVGVPCEIVQYVARAAEGRLRIHHPRLAMERPEPRAKGSLGSERREGAGKVQSTLCMRRAQPGDQFWCAVKG